MSVLSSEVYGIPTNQRLALGWPRREASDLSLLTAEVAPNLGMTCVCSYGLGSSDVSSSLRLYHGEGWFQTMTVFKTNCYSSVLCIACLVISTARSPETSRRSNLSIVNVGVDDGSSLENQACFFLYLDA